MTLKYTLTIEGSAEEIEEAKLNSYGIQSKPSGSGCYNYVLSYIITEYKIVTPTYRIKTLVELVREFGEAVTIQRTICGTAVCIGELRIALDWLGKPTYNLDTPKGLEWDKVFMKEVFE
jgi:hypothetical protein